MLRRDKHSSLFCLFFGDEEKGLVTLTPCDNVKKHSFLFVTNDAE